MEKERALQPAKNEKTDEGQENMAPRGINKGFSAMSLLFALFYVSCAFRGNILFELSTFYFSPYTGLTRISGVSSSPWPEGLSCRASRIC